MAEEKYVHGCKVMYEKEAEEGLRYLDDRLDSECTKVFFVYAQQHRTAPFEDQGGRKYLLTYEHGTYMLERK